MSHLALALFAPRSVGLIEEPEPPLAVGQIRIRTLLSGISSGTELATYRGTNPYLAKRWDARLRLFQPDPAGGSLTYPVTTWGYEEVGEVVEAAPGADVPPGSLVYGSWGHRSHTVVDASWARERVLPPGADPRIGLFSHIGAVALNGVLDTHPRLGETVVVFGLGVVGLLVGQLLRLAGARVVGVDLLAARREMAERLGFHVVLDAAAAVASTVKAELTDGRGADVCVEASGSTRALHEAIRCAAVGGRVVTLGFYQGDAAGLLLGEEFHHNRLTVQCSQIGGVSPEIQQRWNRRRLVQTFMRLAMDGSVRCAELVSHVIPASQAAEAFRLIDEQPHDVLQAVLDFSGLPAES